MENEQSTTQWLNLLKLGDQDAATPLWNSYFHRLLALARKKLSSNPVRAADEEDVVLSAFQSFCEGAAKGKFERLENRDDLWQVLAVITTRKAFRQMSLERAQKRGGGQVRGESVFASRKEDDPACGIQDVATGGPTPEFMAIADEEMENLLSRLPDPALREIALAKLEGYTNEEIADSISRHPRSVERKLQLIRKHWQVDES